MATKRVFELSEASFVDLKAELIRKETQFKREKHGESEKKISRQPKKPPIWAKVKKEAKVTNAGESTKQNELSLEEKQALEKSRRALEAKAALYEKMARGEIEDDEAEGEEGGRFLVDFHKKVYSKEEESNQDSEELKDDDIPPPSGPEEEWVDYVDSLGRARKCLRKDLKELQDMDKDMAARKSPPTLLSEDMRRELMRQKWEKEEEEAMNKPVGPVHYQDIRFDEIRNLGVGYYQFSTNEEERQEQMKTLDKLREQTTEQRVRAQKLKGKRKAALDARLAKVRERKLKKLKESGELNEEAVEDGKQPEEKEENATVEDAGKTASDQGVEERLLAREDEKVVSSRRPERKADLPEWAQHKIKQTDRPRPASAHNDPRSERNQEFAPPAFYFEENTGGKTKKDMRKEPPKLFKHENKMNDIRQETQNENCHPPQGQQIQYQRPQEQSDLQRQPPPHPPEFPPLPPPPQEYVQPLWTGQQWQSPPNMPPPPLSQQLPWQPHFPINVPPPPPSLWRPNIPPWQPPQVPYSMGTALFPSPSAAWSGSTTNSNSSLPARVTESDFTPAVSSGNIQTNNESKGCRERTVPSTQAVADFVTQFRSSN